MRIDQRRPSAIRRTTSEVGPTTRKQHSDLDHHQERTTERATTLRDRRDDTTPDDEQRRRGDDRREGQITMRECGVGRGRRHRESRSRCERCGVGGRGDATVTVPDVTRRWGWEGDNSETAILRERRSDGDGEGNDDIADLKLECCSCLLGLKEVSVILSLYTSCCGLLRSRVYGLGRIVSRPFGTSLQTGGPRVWTTEPRLREIVWSVETLEIWSGNVGWGCPPVRSRYAYLRQKRP